MQINRRNTGKTMSMTMGLAIGAAISVCIMIAGAALTSRMLEKEILQWEHVGYGIVLILLISSFAGSAFSICKIKRRKLLVCTESAFIYTSVLLVITALFFGGQYEAIGVTVSVISAGSLSALLCIGKSRGKRKKKYRTYC